MSKMIKVFHGSDSKFDNFDASKIGKNIGTAGGFGVYFAADKNNALNYAKQGYIYTCNVPINKQLMSNSISMSENELKNLIKELDKVDDYLSNYGDRSSINQEDLLNNAVENILSSSTSDVEVIGDLVNTSDLETVLNKAHEVLGYDHAIYYANGDENNPQEYISLVPNEIEIENVISVEHEGIENEATSDEEISESVYRKIIDSYQGESIYPGEDPYPVIVYDKPWEAKKYNSFTQALQHELSELEADGKVDQVLSRLDLTQEEQKFLSYDPNLRIFVDMDGVLAVFNNQIESEEVLFQKGYYASLPPQDEVVKTVRELDQKYPGRVHILSAVLDSDYAAEEKQEWLKNYLPEVSQDRIILSEYGKPKHDFIEGGIRSSDVLIDDYTKNLTEWKQAGGNGIKLINEINDTNQTWDGHRVHYQDKELLNKTEQSLKQIYSGEAPMKQNPGELVIKLSYVSGSSELVETTIQELNDRFANVKNSDAPVVRMSLMIDEKQILNDEVISKEDLLKHEDDFKNKNSLSLLEVAKERIKENMMQSSDIKEQVDQYSKISKFEDHLQTKEQLNQSVDEYVIVEEAVHIS